MSATALAALAVGHRIEAVAYTVCEGYCVGVATVGGQWRGAGRRDRGATLFQTRYRAYFVRKRWVPILHLRLACGKMRPMKIALSHWRKCILRTVKTRKLINRVKYGGVRRIVQAWRRLVGDELVREHGDDFVDGVVRVLVAEDVGICSHEYSQNTGARVDNFAARGVLALVDGVDDPWRRSGRPRGLAGQGRQGRRRRNGPRVCHGGTRRALLDRREARVLNDDRARLLPAPMEEAPPDRQRGREAELGRCSPSRGNGTVTPGARRRLSLIHI